MGLPVLYRAFKAFDDLVKLQRKKYPEAWERDGCPRGFLPWSAQWKGPSRAGATQRCSLLWLFKTPEWASSDLMAMACLRRFRRMVGLWNFVVMPIYAVAFVIAITRG